MTGSQNIRRTCYLADLRVTINITINNIIKCTDEQGDNDTSVTSLIKALGNVKRLNHHHGLYLETMQAFMQH